jgi:hypothetical protein
VEEAKPSEAFEYCARRPTRQLTAEGNSTVSQLGEQLGVSKKWDLI